MTLTAIVTDSGGRELGPSGEVTLRNPSPFLTGVRHYMPKARREPDGRFVFEQVVPGVRGRGVHHAGPVERCPASVTWHDDGR